MIYQKTTHEYAAVTKLDFRALRYRDPELAECFGIRNKHNAMCTQSKYAEWASLRRKEADREEIPG